MRNIDLHTHTTFSDGTYTPTEIIKTAHSKGITAIAITDHDTIKGLNEAEVASNKYGVELIKGVELSCYIGNLEVHILGYMIDENNDVLNNALIELSQSRKDRNKKMIQKFKDIGIDISYEELLGNTNGTSITRSQFADALVQKGIVSSKNEAFTKYLLPTCETYVQRKEVTPEKTVELIKKVGGVPVLAHPLRYGLSFSEIDELVKRLIPYGLAGIETIYPKTTLEDTNKIKEIANKHGLIITGGSDFHGLAKPMLNLGSGYNNDILVPYELLNKMREQI